MMYTREKGMWPIVMRAWPTYIIMSVYYLFYITIVDDNIT